MAEFSATANLDVVVSQDSLRSAKRQIERELGDVQVGVSSNRPTGGGAVGAAGPEPAGVDLSRRQLGQQEELVELATERNDLLEDFLDESGGGGGALRTAGTFGLGARLAGGGALAGGGPFGALAALTLGGFGLAGLLRTPEADRPGPGRPNPPPEDTDDFGPRFPGVPGGLIGDPPGGFRQPPPPGEGGRGDRRTNINANPNINVNAQGPTRNEIEMLIEGRFRDFSNEIKREIEGLLGSGGSSRNAPNIGGGGGGAQGPRPF